MKIWSDKAWEGMVKKASNEGGIRESKAFLISFSTYFGDCLLGLVYVYQHFKGKARLEPFVFCL